jgi:hypothetical protein
MTTATWWHRILATDATEEEPPMTIGPVEYIIIGFPDNDFHGEILPELTKLVESDTIRILDLVFVSKTAEGEIVIAEFNEQEAIIELAGADSGSSGLIGQEDIEHAAFELEPNTSAALLIWEDRWAGPFVQAMRNSGGILLEGARIPHEVIELALSEIAAAE